jgi:hypothetical protein
MELFRLVQELSGAQPVATAAPSEA